MDDEASQVLLKRLLDSSILRSCSSVFSAFDESVMFQDGSDLSIQQNFKGVFHNISSILDCVQCQQCKLHGKMAMLGYGTALKILFVPPERLSLERNEVVALINTAGRLSESLIEARELTTLYWEQERAKDDEEAKLPAPQSVPSPTPTSFGSPVDSLDILDITVGAIAALGKENLISMDREKELVELALTKHPELLILGKHYGNDAQRFLVMSASIGALTAQEALAPIRPPDAIVVGSGLAGLAASLNILDRGGTVVVLEKEHSLGGNSNKASSGINGCCPQKDAYNDSLESFRNDTIRSAGDTADVALISTLVSNSEKAVTWLMERANVDLSLLAQLGGHSYKRTHRPSNGMAGAEIMYQMQKAVRAYEKTGKLAILVDTKVTQLVMENDQVVGVMCESTVDGSVQEIRADNVILATGGFASDRSQGSYLDQNRPEYMSFPATAGDFSTGDGITLATALGAATRDMDKIQIHPTGWVDPTDPSNPTKMLAAELMRGVGGILLSPISGERFCNELGTRAYVTDKMLQHDPKYAKTGKWDTRSEVPTFNLVLSSAATADGGKKHVDLYAHKGLLTRVEGLDGLSKHTGIAKVTLEKTIRNYQKAAQKGEDEFGKTEFRGIPMKDLSSEVFYVGTVTPVLHYCMGGIKIDTEGNVLREDGAAIPGLHAAGEVTGGVHGNNRLGGNSLLECTVFGTIVGQKIPVKEGPSRLAIAVPRSRKTDTKSSELPVITMEELAKHNTEEDLWVAVHGVVYDFTEFAHEHPAGFQSIFDLAGTDGTEAFTAVHNQGMLEDFEEDKKGTLKTA
jgi:flavocytochrome c